MLADRRRPALLTVLVAAALALAGCSGGSDDGGADATASGSSSSAAPAGTVTDLRSITVSEPEEGATGAAAVPQVTVPAGLSVEKTITEVTTKGTGDAVKTGDVVSVDFVGVDGVTGTQFGASSWAGAPVSFVLGKGVIPAFTTALEGVPAGSTVLVAVAPADGYGPQGGLEQAGIGADDTLVYLIRVDAVAPGWATGTPVTPPAGLPTVSVDPTTHVPTVTVDTAATPPTALVSQALVMGTGAATAEGQTVTVQYTGVNWRTGEVFDSSWTTGTPLDFQLGAGNVIPGWDQGLVGVPVGSQVLLVVPPDLGYGPSGGQESAGITATDTLVFVVDVLAAQ